MIDAVDDKTALVSFMYVNNETGAILPAAEIIQGVRRKNPNTLIHCDCVQGFGKVPFKVFKYDVDLLSASAHKIHGPKGTGCLYIKSGVQIAGRVFGGRQESGVRPGTENVAGIVGFGKACELVLPRILKNEEYVSALQSKLLDGLNRIPQIRLNMPDQHSPFVLNFSVLGIESSDIVTYMSTKGIYVSAGSACERGAKSHVLQAAKLEPTRCAGALRIGLSHQNTVEELEYFLSELEKFVQNRLNA